jgi:hypothetical protein
MMLEKQEYHLQAKLCTALKQDLSYIPQTYGSFSLMQGKKLCSHVAKYFGYDVESDKRKIAGFALKRIIFL